MPPEHPAEWQKPPETSETIWEKLFKVYFEFFGLVHVLLYITGIVIFFKNENHFITYYMIENKIINQDPYFNTETTDTTKQNLSSML